MIRERLMQQARRARRHAGARAAGHALAVELFRPRLGAVPGRLRRLLAPAAAALGLAACLGLAGLAGLALAVALAAVALLVAVLHLVFGIELDLAPAR